MTMTPQQLWDAALTLENDGEFYKEYTNYASASTPFADGRRSIISRALIRLRILTGEVEDREQLRRYHDNAWQLPPARHRTDELSQRAAGLNTIEFWKDEVRFPKKEVALPTTIAGLGAPQPGAVYWKHAIWQDRAPSNHGVFYTSDDIDTMVRMFYGGCGAPLIAGKLRRKHNSIAAKLKEMRLLTFSSESDTWHVALNLPSMEAVLSRQLSPLSPEEITKITQHNQVASTFDELYDKVFDGDKGDTNAYVSLSTAQALTHTKETTMTAPIIEVTTKTLINGIDIATMADSVIYSTIANQEAEIEKLEKIKNKPKRLVAEIEKRQAGIKALVDHLDGKSLT